MAVTELGPASWRLTLTQVGTCGPWSTPSLDPSEQQPDRLQPISLRFSGLMEQ